jgi:hypothetical protein
VTSDPNQQPAKRSYLKIAFANPYNLALLGGAVAASVLTLNPIIALAALGAEGLWLVHAPDSRLLRKTLWDPQFEREEQEQLMRLRSDRVNSLPMAERGRCGELFAKQQQINHLAAENPSFTGDLLRSELSKMRKLVDAFVELAITCSRYQDYLETVDLRALDNDRRNYELLSQSDKNTPQEREIAKKNLAVILKRLDKLKEIHNSLGVARSQLDLIENSFRLIADQIVTMQSPTELAGQLDDLLDGVESVKQTAVDTEKIMSALEA